MRNPAILISSIITVVFLVVSCCPEQENNNKEVIPQVQDNFDNESKENCFNTSSIIYDVEVIADTADYFRVECLKEFKQTEFVEIIFDAIYSGKLKAFDISTEKELSIKDVKKLEETDGYNRTKVGKMQFNESWQLNKETFQFEKRVIWVKMGYTIYNPDGSIRGYAPLFGVWMK